MISLKLIHLSTTSNVSAKRFMSSQSKYCDGNVLFYSVSLSDTRSKVSLLHWRTYIRTECLDYKQILLFGGSLHNST